jgi:hypothetical protein
LTPLATALIERSCGHDQMHMWVVIEIAFMGMEDSMGTAAATHLWIAACNVPRQPPWPIRDNQVGR